MNFLMDLDPNCLWAMSLILYVFHEEKLQSPWLSKKMDYHPEKWLNHQTYFLLMELETYPGFQCSHEYEKHISCIETLSGYLP